MSFDMNLITKNLSNVQASAKSQDGGAGNTGYFMRGEQDEDLGIRFKDSGSDIFEKAKDTSQEEEDTQSLLSLFLEFIEKIIDKIKALFTHSDKQ